MTIPARPTNVMRMETSDESLARAAAEGDSHAFSLLLERHYDRVFRLAFRLTGAAAEAEDLTQDVCAALPAPFFVADIRTNCTRLCVLVAVGHRPRALQPISKAAGLMMTRARA